jgi:peroxiredoxin
VIPFRGRRALPFLAALALRAGAQSAPPPETPATLEQVAVLKLEMIRGLEQVDPQPDALAGTLAAAAPAGLDAAALGAGWLFGSVPVTKTESIPYAVDVARERLAFDADRNAVLTPAEIVRRDTTLAGAAWFPVMGLVRQEIAGAVREEHVPMKVGVRLNAPAGMSRLDGFRRGSIVVGTQRTTLAVIDRTFRGWFSQLGRDRILVDVDGDGSLDTSADSHERYRLGEPFPLGDQDVVVTDVGPFGSTLTLSLSPQPALRKPSLREGAKAPPFTASTLDGQRVDLGAWRGKWVLLDFWATWCGPCRGELPGLKALRAAQPGLVMLGISNDREEAALRAFTEREKIDWPQVFADGAAVQRLYRVDSLPRAFLIAPDGTIAARDPRGPEGMKRVQQLMTATSARGPSPP